MNRSSIRPLSHLPAGTEARVVALEGGRGLQSRLVSMGLNVGCDVRVVRSGRASRGPTLIALGQMRLAIGHGMAERIMVSTGGA